ncbi:GntR family transcriptional regulator [Sphingomonas sp. CL5.1]|uniref:GntR family transcriptional regulator n=1 Tax=Sphingomonas sp. CL5.1 TaxID=2653203 RepID=UPI0015826095|nr:GntR family transcriptional regulator [Sphingomonas sp. CL5.1]QKR98303.1 GntR family transcriptional regulator [Sphingomonas sp. CL5.1]
MNPAPLFDRVYAGVRARLLSGEWPPGHRIDLASLADALGASVTPVRDALYRLNGERLLAVGVHDGFAVPAITEPELHDLYAWNRDLLVIAQMNFGSAKYTIDDPREGNMVERAERLFQAIGASSHNPEHGIAIEAVSDRLRTARIAEVRLGIADERELRVLIKIVAGGNAPALRNQIELYHLRRQTHAGRIVHAMYRPEARG